jgi:hypothetical protein
MKLVAKLLALGMALIEVRRNNKQPFPVGVLFIASYLSCKAEFLSNYVFHLILIDDLFNLIRSDNYNLIK